ncbi:hypothetical protein [Solidesulfovibrio carbinolicus]|uniref:hypothetical protein n=1 Tax=Solidesulfovibrio carbinolicus TaxID=296842 RepID=UPI001012B117|nr:hypothetical protein [Solidesulfovibrio carbinolicus]
MLIDKKIISVIGAVGVNVSPFLVIVSILTSLPVYAALLLTVFVWVSSMLCLKYSVSEKKWMYLWMWTSIFFSLVLLNPGAWTFIAWTINGFAP